MRKIFVIIPGVLCLLFLASRIWADDFELIDGTKVSGTIVYPATVDGLNLRQADDSYKRVAWDKFSQASLQQMNQNPKLVPFVSDLIEPPEEEREKAAEIDIKPVERLDRPAKSSIIAAMFQSSIGMFSLLLIYGASLYAAYEISVIRAYPAVLVCGISAVLPVIGQIIFLCMPTRLITMQEEEAQRLAAESEAQARAAEGQSAPEFHVAGEQPEHAEGGLHLAHESHAPASNVPETLVFARGKFTFNRRFFETKFPGFFGVVRREAEKDMHLLIKSARGEYDAYRISRITANEMHLDVRKGAVSSEVTVPFSEVQEVRLKHKDAP